MNIDLFSKRNTAPCKDLLYDQINETCRLQITNIVFDYFEANHMEPFAGEHFWPAIQKALKDEHGVDSLHRERAVKALGGRVPAWAEIKDYMLKVKDTYKLLDTIEIVFRAMTNSEDHFRTHGFPIMPGAAKEAVDALNKRLAQHCIGYKFEAGYMIKIDNEVLYSMITKELTVFLSNPEYASINEEYMQAHKHYRAGDYKDCVVNAAKSFESTLKVICAKKGYKYEQEMTASPLVKVLFDNHFLPSYMEKTLSGIRSLLEGGVPVVRNKTAAHGAGALQIEVDEGLAAFALNSAGSNIKFLLAELERQL